MSSTTPPSTAAEPPFAVANVVGHPGSTMAGVSAILMGLGTTLASGVLPATPIGWVAMAASMIAGALGMLGK